MKSRFWARSKQNRRPHSYFCFSITQPSVERQWITLRQCTNQSRAIMKAHFNQSFSFIRLFLMRCTVPRRAKLLFLFLGYFVGLQCYNAALHSMIWYFNHIFFIFNLNKPELTILFFCWKKKSRFLFSVYFFSLWKFASCWFIASLWIGGSNVDEKHSSHDSLYELMYIFIRCNRFHLFSFFNNSFNMGRTNVQFIAQCYQHWRTFFSQIETKNEKTNSKEFNRYRPTTLKPPGPNGRQTNARMRRQLHKIENKK